VIAVMVGRAGIEPVAPAVCRQPRNMKRIARDAARYAPRRLVGLK
jgi:hypothetical protein